MLQVLLERMVENLRFNDLPANWCLSSLAKFSKTKTLWDYQEKAVENAIKILWKYYEDFADYHDLEDMKLNQVRKRKFFEWYQDNGHTADFGIPLARLRRDISNLLADYYEPQNKKIPYEQFTNRMCFWMATGSGKTLVLVKLIRILRDLVHLGEIPPNDILVLTHRDDLIEQLKRHVNEFNQDQSDIYIRLRELKDYASAKRDNPSLFREKDLTVFYYHSHNLGDEQKEKRVDFRNYDNEGRWYVLLDEAHKGDRKDSKRQHIYSILSRNGFLFNFSATFTDPRDLLTTVLNFNLDKFINSGYGKHIAILKQEIRAFRDREEYSDEEKQKVVLKSLLMLTYVGTCCARIRRIDGGLYHRPMLLTLVHSVNTDDADLKLFFRELERFAKGEIDESVFRDAKEELWSELKERPDLLFEDGRRVDIKKALFDALEEKDILKYVCNSKSPGEIEILIRPSNRQEMAFKVKTSDRPFALVRIGDISGWLRDELTGYEINESIVDESFFERLNDDDSEVNILMGSRSFYEGWDSNRPNVMNFINIGMGFNAKKFVLQSVGRGVRIEPIKHKRRRLLPLYNAREVGEGLFRQIGGEVLPVETLFIFGTNRQALLTVIGHMADIRTKEQQIRLLENVAAREHQLLIPTYAQSEETLVRRTGFESFEAAQSDLELLQKYLNFVQDDRVLLARHDATPDKVAILRAAFTMSREFHRTEGPKLRNLRRLVDRVLEYMSITPKEFQGLKKLGREIRHFENVRVSFEDIRDLSKKVEKVSNYPILARQLREQYGKISAEEYTEKAKSLSKNEEFNRNGKAIRIKYIANHYYIPVILSDAEKIDYIKHIIRVPSEVNFVNDLEEYLAIKNQFEEFDWWLFSKLDESLDEVYIPYYDRKTNRMRSFNPDFVFWLQKRNHYFIVFIDPKGTSHTDYMYKIDGYSTLFEGDGGTRPKTIQHNGLTVRVLVFLYTDNVSNLSEKGYRRYWFDSIPKVLANVLSQC